MQIITTLAGASFRPADARAAVTHLLIGDKLPLQADPHNEHDPSAVRVLSNSLHIGFIAKKDNPEIFEELVNGNELSAEVIAFETTLKPVLDINW